MARRVIMGAFVSTAICLSLAASAGAAASTQLVLSQSAAFSILGHSCGGIQEHAYASEFAPSGYPSGAVYMQTSCGGSGRGGGYKSTTYSAWAAVAWTWFGETRSSSRLTSAPEGLSTSFSAEDSHGDRIYNSATAAYLELGSPPLAPPAAPTGITAVVSPTESEESLVLRFLVSWVPAPETAGLISSSTVTAAPVGSGAPVLTATAGGSATSALIGPLQHHTTYRITVTSTDSEGTSLASNPIEEGSSGPESPPPAAETCEANRGTIKLSPGLGETPHYQSITIRGELQACDGPTAVTGATYVAHLKTTEEVTCAALQSASLEPTTTPVSLAVKWAPAEAGTTKGALIMPLSEVPLAGLGGTLEGGPFSTPVSMAAGSVWESFTGGSACGVASGKKKAKAVKTGTFTSTAVEIGG